ncbi:peptidoglycan D,D-transpeptidase FtsI family protein [Profundibacterium mesophilum]|uniref:Cell division protein FtsIpenicillin-binding protein 2 n=1 Tax=Profundibacterium mesophilum KAUST100406-0324 TaxID=1037889 RepID=A0A921TCA3_9RHOB|nr:penicillin-binding protein 2 [Profundibacterium mesophilum]KAF0675448.1 Cell division protein FtsIpenicillin-binding protein 2 [Profundibacterium mesophilum KAUST100406-0324]
MTRIPLRPLARVLRARDRGENPDTIERENLRLRHEAMRDRDRTRAEGRLLVLSIFFFAVFAVVGARMGLMASSAGSEPRARAGGAAITAQRADITDRNGRVLATNLSTFSLYAQPPHMVDKERAARELVKIFPDLDEKRLVEDFTGSRKFLWIKKKLSPEQKQAVHDIGDPGLLFGPREMRLYPNGALAAHVLGGASFGREGVHSAEVIGIAGVEKAFDGYLRDPENGSPLRLSIDMTVQTAMRQVLWGGMRLMNAKGAAGILMDAHSGEIISMVSLPDFDPNDRPRPLLKGDAADSPLFNRAVQGVYELGSTFKIFTTAQAMQLGHVNENTLVDADAPMRWGRFRIKEFENKNYGPLLSVTDVIVKSSNVGTAKMALQIGGERQQDFLRKLGFFDATPVELVEAPGAKPLLPPNWSEIVTITASYGHGFSASPLHLATAYSSLLNGGTLVTPTLLARDKVEPGPRIVSERISRVSREMLRAVVVRGTASFGEVPGYEVGGKTGTANKPKTDGRGYHQDKNINTFASVFPVSDPRYVLVVTLDEASDNTGPKPRRTAGWTAVPVAAEVVRRTAPLLGLRPKIEPAEASALTLTSN